MKKILEPSDIKLAEIKISYSPKIKSSQRPSISSSEDASKLFLKIWDISKIELLEQCYILFLNRSNRVLGWTMLSSGSTAGCIVDPKIVYATAIKANASAIIIAHNHPSGNLKMSEADIILTKKLVEAGRLLEIQLLDHLIITRDSYFSWSENSNH